MNETFDGEKPESTPAVDNESRSDELWESIMNKARQLPVRKLPSASLEERTIRELRSRGLLKRKRIVPTAWLVGSVAASLALFATGVVVGQYLATRTTMNAVASIRSQSDAGAAAAYVQETGTAYVRALSALVNAAEQNQATPQDASRAREVALTALHGAANEIVRLAPNDPVVAKILQGIEQERNQSQNGSQRRSADRQIVWF